MEYKKNNKKIIQHTIKERKQTTNSHEQKLWFR